MSEQRRGLLTGAAAYGIWGLFPLFWPLLEPATPFEILAHRVLWSLVVMGVLVLALGHASSIRALLADARRRRYLALASVVIALNWGGYIWGVNNGHVVETSLGYFINPLVTVLLGVLVLKETLRPAQWAAVGIGFVAVVVLTVDYGRLPWIALLVAGSFATYGFLKKRASLGAFEGLGMETLILAPFALAFLLALQLRGDLTFGHAGAANAALLAGTGVVTAIPLLMFAAAATRLSLTTIGLLQYLGPFIQFLLGLLVFHEAMSTARWIGFGLVWAALVVFTVDAVASRRRAPRPVVTA